MTESNIVLGAFTDGSTGTHLSDSRIRLNADDMSRSWRRCGLTADFLARYYSYCFPYREKATDRISREAAENTISYILNELIENTAKYSDAQNKNVEVLVSLRESDILFEVSNHVTEQRADGFLRLARGLLEGNAEELYVTQLEKNTDSSGLGYLTMINDYGVNLGFRVDRPGEGAFRVTVQATMRWKEA
jgi:hypothetical protein